MRGVNHLVRVADQAIQKANANPGDAVAQTAANKAGDNLARFRQVRRQRNSGH